MRCEYCGSKNERDAYKCKCCGAELPDISASAYYYGVPITREDSNYIYAAAGTCCAWPPISTDEILRENEKWLSEKGR